MGHRETSILIAASPERVFDLWVDPDRLPEWQPDVKSVAVSGGTGAPGTKTAVAYGGPFSVRSTVLESRRPTRHVQRAREFAGLITCTTTASFESAAAGTRADIAFDYVVRGGPLGRLIDRPIGDEMLNRFRRDAAQFKARLEGGADR